MDALLVLGMHNSGTSLLVHMLGLLGGYVGESAEVLQENPSYPLGYGERKDVIQMNNTLLASQELTCFRDTEKYESNRVPPIQLVMFRAMGMRLTQMISDVVKPPRFFVLKDPRLCITLAAWREVLRSSPKTVQICIVRDPRDVADSLFEKKNIPREHTTRLWEVYNQSLLKLSEGLPRLLLRYDDVIQRPLDVMGTLQQFLGTSVSIKEDDLRQVIVPPKARPPRPEPVSDVQQNLLARYPSLS